MNLLTLDLATNIGWTCGPTPDPKFSFGSFRLPSTGADIGAFIFEYDQWLRTKIKSGDVYSIVFEQPILPAQTQISTLRKLYGLTSHTEYVATAMQLRVREAPISKVRAFMGVKRHGPQGKQDMVDAAQGYGYACDDHDAADAIGVRLFTISVERPEVIRAFRMDMGALGMAAGAR